MVEHGPHCDADLRDDGCVCADALDREEQERRLIALAAEWADQLAKAQVEETDRLARQAFS